MAHRQSLTTCYSYSSTLFFRYNYTHLSLKGHRSKTILHLSAQQIRKIQAISRNLKKKSEKSTEPFRRNCISKILNGLQLNRGWLVKGLSTTPFTKNYITRATVNEKSWDWSLNFRLFDRKKFLLLHIFDLWAYF